MGWGIRRRSIGQTSPGSGGRTAHDVARAVEDLRRRRLEIVGHRPGEDRQHPPAAHEQHRRRDLGRAAPGRPGGRAASLVLSGDRARAGSRSISRTGCCPPARSRRSSGASRSGSRPRPSRSRPAPQRVEHEELAEEARQRRHPRHADRGGEEQRREEARSARWRAGRQRCRFAAAASRRGRRRGTAPPPRRWNGRGSRAPPSVACGEKAATARRSVPIEPTTENAMSGRSRRAPGRRRPRPPPSPPPPAQPGRPPCPAVAGTPGPEGMVWTRMIA
jgi:hypothetical protein